MSKTISLLLSVLVSSALMTQCANSTNVKEVINKAEAFPFDQIIRRYQKDYNVDDETARMHEQELKRYLILASTSRQSLPMMSPDVDNLWHTFLLFTKDYQHFCREVAGTYIHHVPTIEQAPYEDIEAAANNFIQLYTTTFGSVPSRKIWNGVYASCMDCSVGWCSTCNSKCGSCNSQDSSVFTI